MTDDVLLVEQNGYVATFTINQPEKRNSLNPEIHAGMVKHIDRLSEEGQTRCLVIKGQGDLAFSAGDDLKRAPGDPGPQPDPDKDPKLQWPHRKTVEAIFDAPFSVVAMIDGYCVGGGLALATECDMRICTDRAQLGIPPSRLGIIYDYERIQVFIDLVGPAFTKELFCSGLRINPQRALDMGLVNQVVKPEDLESEVYTLADEFAHNAPLSLREHKRIVNTLVRRNFQGSALTAKDIGSMHEAQRVARDSHDANEGRVAFAEKRTPVFLGR
ncbi:MAG: enoyl-CoA hydratase-related protein [SAR202 cluster bacterium]|jgi:enoyl-CoA hydratase/carnithine racemase|nr:enoyl-CoA hydratase-related protein [SAR202 cluster bacterium]MDP7102341.1 enoyl-CoA hydratase-related protein [SAR202 cluster bacterium]MDP7225464.1 enoyl-CoA hydratase-related protein [SAR202 cluster bacterium]MDP7414137.1 enoyl-CoA hydratase-related protein [SAR202 cluster bacterium]MDP7532659.1 enoyl-CoA hydratase-related protein [SAR202 cluster bacterium]|tara:strand:+ start:1586 stop:2401 length:816 start_codon:yes stop_codon:yes gene_type:complete